MVNFFERFTGGNSSQHDGDVERADATIEARNATGNEQVQEGGMDRDREVRVGQILDQFKGGVIRLLQMNLADSNLSGLHSSMKELQATFEERLNTVRQSPTENSIGALETWVVESAGELRAEAVKKEFQKLRDRLSRGRSPLDVV